MNTHGGSRKGAGRPRTLIDDKRLLKLRADGISMREIAERFGVTIMVVRCALDRIKRNDTPTS